MGARRGASPPPLGDRADRDLTGVLGQLDEPAQPEHGPAVEGPPVGQPECPAAGPGAVEDVSVHRSLATRLEGESSFYLDVIQGRSANAERAGYELGLAGLPCERSA